MGTWYGQRGLTSPCALHGMVAWSKRFDQPMHLAWTVARSKIEDQPTCLDLAKSIRWLESQGVGGKVLGAAMWPMWVEGPWKLHEKALGRCLIVGISKGLRKKAISHSKALLVLPCVYLCLC